MRKDELYLSMLYKRQSQAISYRLINRFKEPNRISLSKNRFINDCPFKYILFLMCNIHIFRFPVSEVNTLYEGVTAMPKKNLRQTEGRKQRIVKKTELTTMEEMSRWNEVSNDIANDIANTKPP